MSRDDAFLLCVAVDALTRDMRQNRSVASYVISEAWQLVDRVPKRGPLHEYAKAYIDFQYGVGPKPDWWVRKHPRCLTQSEQDSFQNGEST